MTKAYSITSEINITEG